MILKLGMHLAQSFLFRYPIQYLKSVYWLIQAQIRYYLIYFFFLKSAHFTGAGWSHFSMFEVPQGRSSSFYTCERFSYYVVKKLHCYNFTEADWELFHVDQLYLADVQSFNKMYQLSAFRL